MNSLSCLSTCACSKSAFRSNLGADAVLNSSKQLRYMNSLSCLSGCACSKSAFGAIWVLAPFWTVENNFDICKVIYLVWLEDLAHGNIQCYFWLYRIYVLKDVNSNFVLWLQTASSPIGAAIRITSISITCIVLSEIKLSRWKFWLIVSFLNAVIVRFLALKILYRLFNHCALGSIRVRNLWLTLTQTNFPSRSDNALARVLLLISV